MAENKTTAAKKDKRGRAANYTEQETRLLINLVVENQETIENKVSDAVTWREKSDAWDKVAASFNARNPENIHRHAATLKAKYETTKKALKKKVAQQKCSIYKTGGGSGENIVYKDWEEKLLAILKLIAYGLPANRDSDVLQVHSPENVQNCQTDEQEIHVGEILLNDKNSLESALIEVVYDEEGDCSTIGDKDGVDVVPVCTAAYNEVEEKRTVDLGATNGDAKWDSWSPNLLRKRKSLILRQQQSSKAKTSKKDILNTKYDVIADDRRNLILLQTELAKKEIELVNVKILREEEMRSIEKERAQN